MKESTFMFIFATATSIFGITFLLFGNSPESLVMGVGFIVIQFVCLAGSKILVKLEAIEKHKEETK